MSAYLISCPNATCAVPEPYREVFRGAEETVMSTAGWEPGALNLAQAFAMRFRTPLVHGDVTRLLLDFEKDGDDRWSEYSAKLPDATRQRIAERHERSYRGQLAARIQEDLRRHPAVVHLMVHTEAGSEGVLRMTTAPEAHLALALANAWKNEIGDAQLQVLAPSERIADAAARELSARFPLDRYVQIELSVSQTFFLEGRPWRWDTLKKRLMDSLVAVVEREPRISGLTDPSIAPS